MQEQEKEMEQEEEQDEVLKELFQQAGCDSGERHRSWEDSVFSQDLADLWDLQQGNLQRLSSLTCLASSQSPLLVEVCFA
jgi:hypothetical protein